MDAGARLRARPGCVPSGTALLILSAQDGLRRYKPCNAAVATPAAECLTMTEHADVQLIPWRDMLARHGPAWRRLWLDAGAVPDLGPAWAMALVHGYRLDPGLLWCVVARRPDGELDLVWPLQQQRVRRWRMGWWTIGPLLNVYCMHSGLLCRGAPERARALAWQALSRQGPRWDWLEVDSVVEGSAEHAGWLALAETRAAGVLCDARHRSPYLEHPGTFDELIAQRSRNFRDVTRVRRRDLHRGLADGGSLAWQHFNLPEQMPTYLDFAHQVELKSWKHANGSAITSREGETGFYEHLLPALAAEGQVHCTVLFLQGQPVAHSIDLLGRQRTYGMKTSYDRSHAKLRPGVLLMVGRLERYFADGMREYDFLGDVEPYKMEWTPTTRDHLRLRIVASTWRGRAAWAIERAVMAARRLRGDADKEADKGAGEPRPPAPDAADA